MTCRILERFIAIGVLFAICASSASAWPHEEDHKALVRFMATGTLIRSTWFRNEDTYLTELNLLQSNEAVPVRLVNACLSEAPPLAPEVLKLDVGVFFAVWRDAARDRLFREILLRAAPGDPMVILPERPGYRPRSLPTIEPNSIIQRYRTLRR